MRSNKNTMLSVFLSQQSARSESDAASILEQARAEEGFVGGRVIAPDRQRKKLWLVQMCFKDVGGRPPQGMARLQFPAESDLGNSYGLGKTGTHA